jgi:D-aminopeptidase
LILFFVKLNLNSLINGGMTMSKRMRLRELGIQVGAHPTGPLNAITDVPGVQVGHVTLHHNYENGSTVRTGVTAILPHLGNLFHKKVVAASHVINGFGKTTGLVQLDELGLIESPILLTNTFGVPAVTEGTLKYLIQQNSEIGDTTGTVNVVVGECNDGFLNDIRGLHVRPEHAIQAIAAAQGGPIEEGAVGAGTGMMCFQYKGGIGTSSRVMDVNGKTYTLGCLVLTNYGKREDLRLPAGWLGGLATSRVVQAESRDQQISDNVGKDDDASDLGLTPGTHAAPPDGSIMIILATDAPLSDRQLKRLAKRASFGLARTGSHASHGSGDIVIAFSNAQYVDHHSAAPKRSFTFIDEAGTVITTLFQMTAETVEEAIWNSLCKAETTTGRQGRVVEELPYK